MGSRNGGNTSALAINPEYVDAMIYKRPYNKPITFREAAAEVRRCSGTHFDPEIIDRMLEFLGGSIPKKLL